MKQSSKLAYISAVLVGILLTGTLVGVTTQTTNAYNAPSTLTITDTPEDKESILWLARAIYSETKVPWEMGLIAWVVRNRVETNYKGSTYKEVVLSKNQFSGLNSSDHNYGHNISRTYESEGVEWQNALIIAKAIYYAEDEMRPIPQTVRHFYSPRSMKNGRTPDWAKGRSAIHMIGDVRENSIRFAFYDGIK